MWAILHAFEHNNLDGMTLISAPKYGRTARSWARKLHQRSSAEKCWSPSIFGNRPTGLIVMFPDNEMVHQGRISAPCRFPF